LQYEKWISPASLWEKLDGDPEDIATAVLSIISSAIWQALDQGKFQ
jgi:hypothetical protein